jgi:hypothetical protein
MEGELCGPHWDALCALLPLYQAITTVEIVGGTTTSFWYDVWQGQELRISSPIVSPRS